MSDITKQYSNEKITIVWKPDVCVHSTLCWKQLSEVFHPAVRPWITMEGADTERIISQVNRCPSGALSYFQNTEKDSIKDVQAESKVQVIPKGPLLIYGKVTVVDATDHAKTTHKVTALCRCGQSTNAPYCDGSHLNLTPGE